MLSLLAIYFSLCIYSHRVTHIHHSPLNHCSNRCHVIDHEEFAVIDYFLKSLKFLIISISCRSCSLASFFKIRKHCLNINQFFDLDLSLPHLINLSLVFTYLSDCFCCLPQTMWGYFDYPWFPHF